MNKLPYIDTTYTDTKPSNIQDNKHVPVSIAEKLTKEELELLNKNTEELNRLKRELNKKNEK